MCGAEALLLALKLASGLVELKDDGTRLNNFTITVCGCDCGLVGSAYYSCMAASAANKEARLREHNAEVKEFQQIVKMCLPPEKK